MYPETGGNLLKADFCHKNLLVWQSALRYLESFKNGHNAKEAPVMDTQPDSTRNNTTNGSPPLIRSCKTLYLTGSAMLMFSLLGCAAGSSMSESSNSISTSFESSSKSSTSSSEERKEAYQGDVRHYTEVYTRSNSDLAGFAKGLSSIGEKHGTTNWEADNSTYLGIGEGLAKANISQRQVDIYMTYLTQGDPVKIAAIQKGLGLAH